MVPAARTRILVQPMLTDVDFLFAQRLSRAQAFFSSPEGAGFGMDPERVMAGFGYESPVPGVYLVGPNGRKALDGVVDREREIAEPFRRDGRFHGVADDVAQVIAHVDAEALGFPCCLVLTPVARRFEKPDGWRWRKFGPYIGTRTPRAEYLADEPEIEEIVVFALVPLHPERLAGARVDAIGACA